ncbi:MAG: hypothetical protein E6J78_08320 [Deltaproteobacteria bacterium]|nr:MAG: hypothetical protein E6J78_08320 [Deltaproteobacteria bacterium]
MGYRIEVGVEARSILETLAPYVVLRLGQALARLAEALTFGEELPARSLELDGCVLELDVDPRAQILRVVSLLPLGVEAVTPA